MFNDELERKKFNISHQNRMPLKIKQVKTNRYQVKNTSNGTVHAKGTTLNKAKKQVRLLGMMSVRGSKSPLTKSAAKVPGHGRFGVMVE